jgi:hypothetical protein
MAATLYVGKLEVVENRVGLKTGYGAADGDRGGNRILGDGEETKERGKQH